MSTLAAEPIVEEMHVASSPIPEFQREQIVHTLPVEKAVEAEEKNPFIVILVVCFVAFNLAAAMIGTMAAWIYELRHSGAFAP